MSIDISKNQLVYHRKVGAASSINLPVPGDPDIVHVIDTTGVQTGANSNHSTNIWQRSSSTSYADIDTKHQAKGCVRYVQWDENAQKYFIVGHYGPDGTKGINTLTPAGDGSGQAFAPMFGSFMYIGVAVTTISDVRLSDMAVQIGWRYYINYARAPALTISHNPALGVPPVTIPAAPSNGIIRHAVCEYLSPRWRIDIIT